MKMLKEYFELQEKIHDYFGYIEDWVVIPLDDATEMYWELRPSGFMMGDSVAFDEDPKNLLPENEERGEFCQNPIYTQRFLPKYIYRGEDFTMICVDTRVDGNKFLQVFDNKKEITTNNEGLVLDEIK